MRRAVAVLGLWLVAGFLLLPLAGKIDDVTSSDPALVLPQDAEATRALLRAREAFPGLDTPMAVVVYVRDGGLTDADRSTVDADRTVFEGLATGHVVGPATASRDGQALLLSFPVADKAVVKQVKAALADSPAGLRAEVTGSAGALSDFDDAGQGADATLFIAAAGIVAVLLLLTYRSPVLWVVPLLAAVVASQLSSALVYLMGRHLDVTVTADLTTMMTVLVFGAGTDYALLLIARYREELRRHEDRHEAMAEALHRSGPAIIASAATVVLGMLCLFFAETNSTKGLGPVAAIGIAVGLAVMLTLLPVLLTICGRWIFWPLRPKAGSAEPTTTGLWARVGDRIARRPRGVWIVTTLVLAVATVGVVQLDATGLTNKESFRGTQDSIVGEEVLARHGAGGAGSPVVVISTAAAAAATKAAFAGVPGIDKASVSEPAVKGDYAYVTGDLVDQPDSQAAYDTVDRVRAAVHAVPGAAAKVGGTTAINLDVQRAAKHDRDLIIPIVLAVVLLILILLLRSVLAPVILIATVVLSFGAALGVSALVFRHVFGFGGADSSLPLFVFVFLVALGIDYNIFLMTRVREEAVKHGTRRAALIGLSATGGVITSAGLVLAGTFAVLATLPLTAFAEIGFAVAFGVLLDTIIVRSVLVTALNLDVGERMWWPSALGRATSPAVLEKDPVAA